MTKDEINLALFISALIFGAFLLMTYSNDHPTVTPPEIQKNQEGQPIDEKSSIKKPTQA
jgi:hypothetical protein